VQVPRNDENASLKTDVDLLRRVPFLGGLEDSTLARLAAHVTRHRFARGEPICREGHSCAGVWIVVEGSIRSVKISAGGRFQILDTIGAAGTCSLASVLDGGCCPMLTEARVDSTVLLLPREALLEAIDADPRIGVAIARYLGDRLRGMTCQLVSLSLRDVRARVALFLVEEAARRGRERTDGTVSLELPGSQEELAHRLGTEREVFARALRSLKDEGYIEQVRGRVSIKKVDRLRDLADSS